MKLKNLLSGFASLVVLFGAAGYTAAQVPDIVGSNPGIAIAGSQDYTQIPEKAKAFIEKHFKGVDVKTCEKYFAKDKYEIELANGVDLEFNSEGMLTEVDAPDDAVLPVAVVKEIMPGKAFDRLDKDGLSGMVESIELNRGKVYEVELNIPDPDTYVFDLDGVFIAIEE